jgi:hypothetical protein
MTEYRFITRWQEWGTTPLEILSGFIQHPLKFAMSLFRKSIVLHFVRLGTLPFWDYKGILLFIVPWVINATSGFSQQANMSLYYGIPMFSFACVAAIRGFKSEFFKNFQKRQWSFLFVWGLMMLNVAHYVFPEIPSARNDILKQIERIPKDASVQAMSCFFSVLGYERRKEMITATSDLHSDYILVRTQMTTWPLSEQESELVVAQCRENQAYDIFYQIDDFVMCKRKERFH